MRTCIHQITLKALFIGILCSISSVVAAADVVKDTSVVEHYLEQANEVFNSNPDSAKVYFKNAISIAENLAYSNGLLRGYGPLGYLYELSGDRPTAISYYVKSLQLKQELKDTTGMILTYLTLANISEANNQPDSSIQFYTKAIRFQLIKKDLIGVANTVYRLGLLNSIHGKYSAALAYYNKALLISQRIGEDAIQAYTLNGIGLIYYYQNNSKHALINYNQSLDVFSALDEKSNMGMLLNNIGLVYQKEHKLDTAETYFRRSLEIKKEINDPHGMAYSLNHLGSIYVDLSVKEEKGSSQWNSLLDSALSYFEQALAIRERIYDGKGKSISLLSIAEVNQLKGKYKEAELNAEKSYTLANSLGLVVEIQQAARTLSYIYEKQAKHALALEMYKEYILMNDSLNNKKAFVESAELQAKHEYEKQKLINDANYENLLAIAAEKRERQRILTYFISIGSILLLTALLIIFKRLRVTREQKLIIEEQKKQVDSAYQLLGEKNQEIVDSISYAKRIQTAILPPDNFIKEHLPNSFIYYEPKDIVAGDFYWIQPLSNQILFAVADCTGHGVPGAMVSVICNNALNRSVREYGLNTPGEILDKTRELVIEELKKGNDDVKDGMDIALCSIANEELHYAGAHNPLWIIRNEELIELKADKQPIGKFDFPTPFTTHHFKLQRGDQLYLFSDGYIDQFGGPKGKKYKKSNLRKLLLSLNNYSVSLQKEKIVDELKNWKGEHEQLDDICFMGIQFD